MGKRPTTFNTTKNDWTADSNRAEDLFNRSLSLRTGARRLRAKQANLVQGLAFMRLCHAWEDYLESSLLRYVVGVASGVAPVPTLNPACSRTSLDRAFQVLSGGRASTNYYLQLSQWSQIQALSNRVFATNDPYAFLYAPPYSDAITQAVALRNRVAHSSAKCQAEYKRVVNLLRGSAAGTSLGQGCSVGEFCAETLVAARLPGSAAGTRTFAQFKSFFDHCVGRITP